MKNITAFISALVSLFFSVAASAQITPPYYNPANVAITGGNINNTVIGGTTAAAGTFSNLTANTLFTVGSGATTSAGLIAGYLGSSGYGALWSTGITPSASNYSFATNGTTGTYLRAVSALFLTVGAVDRVSITPSILTAAVPVSVTDATDSSSATTGSLKTAGGLGVAKKAYFGDSINVAAPGTITVGTGSGTSAGLIFGYSGFSGYGGVWSTSVTPSSTNFALASSGANTTFNATTAIALGISNTSKMEVTTSYISHLVDVQFTKTITAPATTGAQTINKTTGRVNFAAAATSLVVTNSLVTANSIVHCTVATNDTTMKSAACVPTAGSFTMYSNAAATAETAVAFTVTN